MSKSERRLRISLPVLTKYEYANIISQRALELAEGAPRTIKNPGTTDPKKIAEMEFRQGTLPKQLKRVFPNGHEEIWDLTELEYFDV